MVQGRRGRPGVRERSRAGLGRGVREVEDTPDWAVPHGRETERGARELLGQAAGQAKGRKKDRPGLGRLGGGPGGR